VLYESYIHPVTILSTLPSAGVGPFSPCSSSARISISSRSSHHPPHRIVKKNAIMMIDFALRRSAKRASLRGGDLPGLSPALPANHDDDHGALLGGLPLALGTGTGSELRRPLGITIVGGLILSQVLSSTHAVVYLYFDRLARRFRRVSDPGALPAGGRRLVAAVRISAPFIRRPIGTSLLAVGLLLAGIIAYRQLPVRPGPPSGFP